MSWIWRKISQLGGSLAWCCTEAATAATTLPPTLSAPQRQRQRAHVRFSPSTLRRQLAQQVEKLASSNPYFNFLMIYNMHLNAWDLETDGLNFHEIGHATYAARQLWQRMSPEKRAPYVALAQRVRRRIISDFQRNRIRDHQQNCMRLIALHKRNDELPHKIPLEVLYKRQN